MPDHRTNLPIEIIPLAGIGEVVAGDDLAGIIHTAIVEAGTALQAGDIVVVTQKIVSKAEGRIVALDGVIPGDEARRLAAITGKDARFVELVLRQSVAVLRAVPNVLITRHTLGLVMANAGIDRSNIGPGDAERVLLLPEQPDRSAGELATALAAYGPKPAVVISDSFGRAWRMGVVAVGIGAAGLPALHDRRGDIDRDGQPLKVTQVAVADLVASAAALATGEGAESVPVVIVRNYRCCGAPRPAASLIRPVAEDLFQ